MYTYVSVEYINSKSSCDKYHTSTHRDLFFKMFIVMNNLNNMDNMNTAAILSMQPINCYHGVADMVYENMRDEKYMIYIFHMMMD